MKEVVIVSAVRSAVGKGKKEGALANVHAVDLSAQLMKTAIERVGHRSGDRSTTCYWGCAMPEATQGLNVARLAWLRAGLPVDVPAATVNRFCSSGLQTVALAAQEIMSGMADVVLAGGVEMMSQVPMSGYHTRLDPEITESYIGMGFTAERVAERWKVTREDQDRWALGSQQKAATRAERAARSTRRSCRSPVERVTWKGAEKTRRRRRVRARRAAAPRHDDRRAREAAAGVQGERHGDRRQREPVLRRRGRGAADDRRSREGARAQAARALHHVRGGGRRAGRHGRRSDQGGAESAQARGAVS